VDQLNDGRGVPRAIAAAAVAGAVLAGVSMSAGLLIGTAMGADSRATRTAAAENAVPDPASSGAESTPTSATDEPTTAPRPTASPGTGVPAIAAPRIEEIDYPLDCSGFGVVVDQAIDHDFTGDGVPEAIRVVACNAGGGSPPHAVLAYGSSPDGAPVLLQTLLDEYDGLRVDLEMDSGALTGTAWGYSSPDVPGCCPDLEGQIQWRWKGSLFVMEAGPGV
jgi:hypothetical protein